MEKLKVLIVDDASNVLDVVKFGLMNNFANIEVDEATNGREAKAKIEIQRYDLILCDWQIPEIAGDQLLQWVRNHPTLNTTPFIMLTAKNEKTHVMHALQLGASSYITKPFTLTGLMQNIGMFVSKFNRRECERFAASNPVSLGFRSAAVNGTLINISLGGLFGSFRRREPFPGILEMVTVDIESADIPHISGLTGFVIRMQAVNAVTDSDFVDVAIKFLDYGAEIKNELVTFFNMLKLEI